MLLRIVKLGSIPASNGEEADYFLDMLSVYPSKTHNYPPVVLNQKQFETTSNLRTFGETFGSMG